MNLGFLILISLGCLVLAGENSFKANKLQKALEEKSIGTTS